MTQPHSAPSRGQKFYITTPIYYVNAPPHMGTAYTTIIADALARTKRMLGFDALLVTGSDEHSQNIADKAAAAHMTPQDFCQKLIPEFHRAWALLDLGHYKFYQTSSPEHREVVQALFKRIWDAGDVYKANYSGWYHTTDNKFVDEADLPENPEEHPFLKHLTEEAYWFRLSKYQDWLLKYHEQHPEAIVPAFRRTEMLNRIQEGLRDLCISRSSTSWGIPLPWDESHVFYVWVDALVTYLTGSGYDISRAPDDQPDTSYWPCNLHIMAKDIPWFHTVIWPAMLHSAGIAPAHQVFVHGYWNFEGTKMSKSKGNVFHPLDAVSLVGSDGVRYFLLKEVRLGADGNFSVRGLAERYNYDLGNDFGNLMHRTLTMVLRYLTGKVPVWKAGGLFPEIEQLRAKVAHQSVAQMERLEFKESLETTWELVSALNRLIDEQKPWAMAKTPERAEELEQFFGIVFRSIRTLLLVLTPILPRACDLYWEQCGLPGQATLETFQALGEDFPEGVTVGQPQVVFPKLDLQRLEEEFIVRKESMTGETVERVEAAPVTVEAPKVVEAVSDECTYEDFLKVRLITCRVVKAEAVAGADKLLRLTVDDGKRKDRTIVSGIRVHFSPEQMEGKTIVVVDNLKPRKIFGILSEGMIMAGGDGTVLRLMTPDGELPPGTKLG